ncbi:glycosyltransferase family 2 protein [Tropicimonas marinistellae]|uniref:glycosyltransferase family 2 protein n=1 Tax=Tropicimonas marinistellae TaxID=1739787 RepID=UPI00082B80AC|nr:glycosyltransferase family 2 protein [Tropicimonas marinistellae]
MTGPDDRPGVTYPAIPPWMGYRMRWKRRRLLWRAIHARRALRPVADRTSRISAKGVLAFTTIRDEAQRLPHFLTHYRQLGVSHFLVVDNGSADGSTEFLAEQSDVSLWSATASYRMSRFGMDWLGWLHWRYGGGHWCLTVDADELLVYPGHELRPLDTLCSGLEASGRQAMGALMLDLYPQRPLTDEACRAPDPLTGLHWFDSGPYRTSRRPRDHALKVQGGVRERVFFPNAPERGPTLNKLPLVRWNRSYVYTNSTHAMLPPRLNHAYDGPGGTVSSGVLLHTKFAPGILKRSANEKSRRQHFGQPHRFDGYYDAILRRPSLWSESSIRYDNWQQLVELGLMSE